MPDPSMNDSERVTVALPSNILAQIDAQIGSQFADRDDFMRAAARHYLDTMRERGGTDQTRMAM
jgi:metal-responsive CopG/Arc/MetJ family transcriptional regulator